MGPVLTFNTGGQRDDYLSPQTELKGPGSRICVEEFN